MDVLVVVALTVGTIVLFAWGRWSLDAVALLLAVSLALTGLVSPEEAVSGFANPATLTVLAMLILAGGLVRTGAAAELGRVIERFGGRSETGLLAALMAVAALTSAFVSNTAVVAVLLPVVVGLARERRLPASRFLIPLSFASMFGGTLTLIGTSTNLVVDSLARQHGLERLRMFEFAPVGIAIVALGVGYVLLAGGRLIPARGAVEPGRSGRLEGFLTELCVGRNSPLLGRALGDAGFEKRHGVEVLEIRRGSRRVFLTSVEPLQAADLLLVRGAPDALLALGEVEGLSLMPDARLAGDDGEPEQAVLAEAVISPTSRLRGRTPEQVFFRQRYDMTILGIRRREESLRERLSRVRLRVGDTLLLKGRRGHLRELARDPDFLLLGERRVEVPRLARLGLSVGILAGVVALSVLGLAPLLVSALLGVVAMVLLGCLTMEEAYDSVDWSVIFVLAGVLPLGIALERTGVAAWLGRALVASCGGLGPFAVLAGVYLATALLSEIVSNNATAVLMTPIAIAAADGVGVDGRPFVFTVAFAASASFLTPVGYQTNMLVYGPGGYRYTDFLRVGAPLSVLLWGLTTFLVPIVWPFEAPDERAAQGAAAEGRARIVAEPRALPARSSVLARLYSAGHDTELSALARDPRPRELARLAGRAPKGRRARAGSRAGAGEPRFRDRPLEALVRDAHARGSARGPPAPAGPVLPALVLRGPARPAPRTGRGGARHGRGAARAGGRRAGQGLPRLLPAGPRRAGAARQPAGPAQRRGRDPRARAGPRLARPALRPREGPRRRGPHARAGEDQPVPDGGRGGDRRARAMLERQGEQLDDVDPAQLEGPLAHLVSEQLSMPYTYGRRLLWDRWREGGWEAVRACFDHRPVSTEQVMHPEKRGLDAPQAIELPPWPEALGAAELVHEDRLGEMAIYGLLLTAGVEHGQAQLAATGWDGDRMRAYRLADGGLAVLWRTVWDREEDARQFASAVAPRGDARVRARGRTVDWVRAKPASLARKLLDALSAAPPELTADPADGESTAAIETGLLAEQGKDPYLAEGRWVQPRYGFSVPVPEGWSETVINGLHVLTGPRTATFADNLNVVTVPNPAGKDVAALLEENRTAIQQYGLTLDEIETRAIDGRDVLWIRYHGNLMQRDVRLTAVIFLHGDEQVVVTVTVLETEWSERREVVDGIFAGMRFG